MLSKLVIGAALFDGIVKGTKLGIKPPPPEPPEAIGIWWCPQCNRWQAWENDNPEPVCYYHNKPGIMHAHFYSHDEALNGAA